MGKACLLAVSREVSREINSNLRSDARRDAATRRDVKCAVCYAPVRQDCKNCCQSWRHSEKALFNSKMWQLKLENGNERDNILVRIWVIWYCCYKFGYFFISHMAPTYLVALTQKQKEQAGKEREERREGKENGRKNRKWRWRIMQWKGRIIG